MKNYSVHSQLAVNDIMTRPDMKIVDPLVDFPFLHKRVDGLLDWISMRTGQSSIKL